MLDKGLIRQITVTTRNKEEQFLVADKIHKQLVGNKDYIDNNILLSMDSPNDVDLYIFEECETIPTITI